MFAIFGRERIKRERERGAEGASRSSVTRRFLHVPGFFPGFLAKFGVGPYAFFLASDCSLTRGAYVLFQNVRPRSHWSK